MKKNYLLIIAVIAIAFTTQAQTPGTWKVTGAMKTARWLHTTTLLNNGKVLVAGGRDASNNATATAELYDPATGSWTPTGSMHIPRGQHTATLLPDGKILVAGGYPTTTSAEIYDPATGVWTLTGNMQTAHIFGMAILITTGPLSGMVMVAGGDPGSGIPVADAELYDPNTGHWNSTGSMKQPRYWDMPSPVALSDGSIMIVGGTTCCPYSWYNEAELFDPVTQTWKITNSKVTKANETTLLLPDHRVLVAGGISGTQTNNKTVADAELFNPATGTWTATTKMLTARSSHTRTLLANGHVLVAGGSSGDGCTNSAELYDPGQGAWSYTGNMTAPRISYAATLLPNGQVLAVGGRDCNYTIYSSTELYTPPECTGLIVYADADSDGYGNASDTLFVADCIVPNGYVLDSTDCDDTNTTIHPKAKEIIGDGIDNNCNGLVDEKINNALSFDGVNDYVNVSHDSTLSLSQVTLECWVKPQNSGVYAGIVTKEPTDASLEVGYGFRQRTDNKFWFVNGREGSNDVASSTTTLIVGTWYHLAGTFDGSTLKLYVNGILEGTSTSSRVINSTADLKIGNVNSLIEYFRGFIDEVRIWKVARTQAEIQSDMNLTGCGDAPGLVAYYSFNQGIAGGNNSNEVTLHDITSNNNDGTLTNFALTGSKSNWVKGVPGLSDSVTLYKDADGDTYGNAAKSIRRSVCHIPDGYVYESTDCNDADSSIHPKAREKCNGIDDNCNAVPDDILGLSTTNIKATRATFNWKLMPRAETYIVKYKRVDPEVTTWSFVEVPAPVVSITVAKLEPSSKYVWRVRSDCGDFNSDLSDPVKFTTAAVLTAGQHNDASLTTTVNELSVYPNPTGGSVTINLTLAKKQSLFIRVSDITGKEVYSSGEGMVSGTFSRQIDLGKLSPGTYFLKIVHDGETEVKKVVLKK